MQRTAGARPPVAQPDAAALPAAKPAADGPHSRAAGTAVVIPRARQSSEAAAAAPQRPHAGRPARVPGLDGVRALAVLAVLGFHENLRWIPGGFLGVDVFFVLSGYLITDLLVIRLHRDGLAGLGTFWLRRARRLLPALALMLVTVTAVLTVTDSVQISSLRQALLGAVTYTSNWQQAFQHQSYFAIFGPPPPLEHLWSLAVEEQFYLIWPLAVTAILLTIDAPRRRALVVAAGAAASAIAMAVGYRTGQDPSRVYFGTDTHATGLMLGAALALCLPLARVSTAGKSLRRRLDLLGIAGLITLGLACWRFSGADPLVYRGGLLMAALAAGGLVLAAAAPGIAGRVLGSQPLRWLGVRSYGIYLWHWPVIAITTAATGRGANSAAARLTDAALPVAIAALSWRWLEEPIQRNGLLPTLRAAAMRTVEACTAARQAPAAALPLLLPATLLAIACTAGYGITHPPAGPSLQQQIAAGQRISLQSQGSEPQLAGTGPLPGAPNRLRFRNRFSGATRHRPPAGLPALLGRKITAIGDSVMLAAAPELHAAMPGISINAKVDRQMGAGIALIRRLAAAGQLRPVVLIGLGTNGTVTPGQIRQLHWAIGPRWLLLINTFVPRPWQREVNLALWSAARHFANVRLVDWRTAIQHRKWLLWNDRVHPQPDGGRLYARLVRYVVQAALRRHQPHRPATHPTAATQPTALGRHR